MTPRPEFFAPHYKGSGKSEDKVAFTGGNSGIEPSIGVHFARERAIVAIISGHP
jgi:hypothetical protein